MPALVLGILALALFLVAAKAFSAANPSVLARLIRLAGALVAIGVGAVLAFSGRGAIGAPLAFFGIVLLRRWFSPGMAGRASRSPGGTSRVRSAMLAMELDLDSGAVRGEVTSGTFAGRSLDSMDESMLAALMRELEASDPDGVSLLEAYLNRRPSGGREDFERDARARHRNPARERAMTEDEAYEILGLDAGAGPEQVRRAHRALMKKVHPDHGGSDWLASRINQARDILLRTRR